ncbi:hypothetical protein GQ53DRAFT_744717 [Thozetella sp. PMI_491]|nr:hypothetical protein GQ53DRAFT_744717 [Thozetella sp. PMI_491]
MEWIAETNPHLHDAQNKQVLRTFRPGSKFSRSTTKCLAIHQTTVGVCDLNQPIILRTTCLTHSPLSTGDRAPRTQGQRKLVDLARGK